MTDRNNPSYFILGSESLIQSTWIPMHDENNDVIGYTLISYQKDHYGGVAIIQRDHSINDADFNHDLLLAVSTNFLHCIS